MPDASTDQGQSTRILHHCMCSITDYRRLILVFHTTAYWTSMPSKWRAGLPGLPALPGVLHCGQAARKGRNFSHSKVAEGAYSILRPLKKLTSHPLQFKFFHSLHFPPTIFARCHCPCRIVRVFRHMCVCDVTMRVRRSLQERNHLHLGGPLRKNEDMRMRDENGKTCTRIMYGAKDNTLGKELKNSMHGPIV